VIVLWMGVYPESFLGAIEVSVANLVKDYHTALAAAADSQITTALK